MPKPSLMLNCIVKNESARIERMLASVEPYVKAVVILDTGSTDDTIAKIREFATAHELPCYVGHGAFKDFSQARNEAFQLAQKVNDTNVPWCQFALLMDADMELVVNNPHELLLLDANALSYDMMQKAGAVSYANRRILNLNWGTAPYVGVTHEYVDVPTAGMITGAHFVDHADGTNRKDKYRRDAQLLEDALKEDPTNCRSWYYLGNTYRDWGKPELATGAYRTRIELGGWDEETHSAMVNSASCRIGTRQPQRFVSEMIDAYNFRPSRAEPLYDLAKYYREKGDTAAALLFAKAGLTKTRPDDLLFVNDFVYEHGLRYEYSIAGYYDEKERNRAFEITDDLALDPTCPAGFRLSARNNLFFYTKPLSTWCPSFSPKRLDFTPPDGYAAMNPSVEECNGKIKCNIRCVNYTIDNDGRYVISGGGEAIDTRNFIVKLGYDMSVRDPSEIMWHRDPAKFNLVTGLEDIRLYRVRGDLWFSACVREQSPHGTCQQAQGRLEYDHADLRYTQVRDFEFLSGEERHEKNWMPLPNNSDRRDRAFAYRLDTIMRYDKDGLRPEKFPLKICPDNISGGSQLIPFKSGLLSVVHEAITGPDGKRTYWHRFAWFEQDGKLRRLSKPFVFLDRQIEFCAGLAYHPNHRDLILSFGVRDAEAWVATVSVEEVAMMCWKHHES